MHDHIEMGNRLINVARRMKVNAANQSNQSQVNLNNGYNYKPLDAYKRVAEERAKKANLTESQKEQIRVTWRET